MKRNYRFYHTRQMYEQLPMKQTSILPDEGMEPRLMRIAETYARDATLIMPVYVKPKPTGHWGHRVIVKCPCGKHVPFGRMNQHYPVCERA